jgi:pyruvate,water dikinase
MCVAGIVMIDAQASGVCYSRDPSNPASSDLTVSAVWGLGEHLVSGEASPDTFSVDRQSLQITQKEINPKPERLVLLEGGGTKLEETGEEERALPAVDEGTVRTIAECSLKLEDHFGSPQDVEWCVDRSGRLFILQSRPLGLSLTRQERDSRADVDPDVHPVLLSEGKSASRGTVSGRVVAAGSLGKGDGLEGGILVAKTASPDYAKLVDSVKGIVTDLGSVASHLASVAREFSIPMIVGAGRATAVLEPGSTITMVADTATVYEGRVAELVESSSLPGEGIFESPVRRKMRDILDLISPLNLTDPEASTFAPEHCRTIHDVIRFSHEKVVKEMFGLAGHRGDDVQSVQLKAGIPLALYFIDLGGGLQENLTTCDEIRPDAIASRPMKALWRGLSHPGISWSGTVSADSRNLMALMTSGPPPQMASYAVLSDEYVNLSIKFGYHYATIDILWADDPEANYISLQFGGGAGSFHGRALRIRFLSEVLEQLGFMLQISGDVVDATVKGYDDPAMEETLDQLGRLLASSRLLDLGIPSREAVDEMKASFFSGDYNFLQQSDQPLPDFYTPTGDWTRVEEDGRVRCLQDGTPSGEGFSCSLKNFMGKMVGSRYQQFLDGIHAYHYFPIAILKESHVGDGWIQTRLTPEAGCLDNTGGLLFGLKAMTTFFMLGLDALEGSVALFEFKEGKRLRHASVEKELRPGESHLLAVRVSGTRIEGFLDGEAVIRFDAEHPVEGYVGLWTKADSKVYFDDLTIQEGERERTAAF